MIYIGNNEYPIYLGDSEIPAIYCGEELIYPVNLGTLTGITIEDLTWVEDVSYSGGTADKDNCSYKVVGHYDSGKSRSVTSKATVTGSLVVSATTADTREAVGTLELTATYSGFTASGTVTVYQAATPPQYERQYFTIRVTSPGKIVWCASTNSFTRTIQYSFDSGATWTSITSSTSTSNGFNVVAGDVVMFKGTTTNYARRSGSTNQYNFFQNTTAQFIVEGNVMSMLYGDNFIGETALTADYALSGFFNNVSGVTDATNLIMPAPVLTAYCYRNFFAGSSITTGVPKLPATTLAEGCYTNMFINSLNLEVAPDLPARTLAVQCYDGMLFMQSATNKLRYIKCLATNMSASNCLRNFHSATNVSSTGVFVKYPGASWATGGATGIPNGWTVIESTE